MIGKHFKKISAVLLSSIIALTAVSSCSVPSLESPEDVADNVTDVIEINSPTPAEETEEEYMGYTADALGQFYSLDYLFVTDIASFSNYTDSCIYKDKIVFSSWSGDYDAVLVESSDFSNGIAFFDMTTNTLETYNITSYINSPIYLSNTFVVGDNLYISGFDINNNDYVYYLVDYDKLHLNQEDALTNVTYYPEYEDVPYAAFKYDYDRVLHFSNGFILNTALNTSKGTLLCGYDELDEYLIFIDSDGTMMFTPYALPFFCKMFSYDSDNIAIMNHMGKDTLLNLTTYEISDEPVELYYAHGNNVSSVSGSDGYYSNSYEGLSYIEPQTKHAEKLLDYNCVIGDTSILTDSYYVGSYNGSYYYVGDAFLEGDYGAVGTISVLTPTNTNPYAGKKVLRMACNELDASVIKNIKEYNDSDSEYFIEYRLVNGTVPTTEGFNVLSAYTREYAGGDATTFYNHLRQDAEVEAMEYALLKEGNYDLMYGFSNYELFNTPELCRDISDSIDCSNLYQNVVDCKRVDGAIYQMPLSFVIDTLICTNDEDTGEGKVLAMDINNTFDSYNTKAEAFGYNPLKANISDYECLVEMIECDFNSYINVNGDTADINNENFGEIFDYSLSNVMVDIESAVVETTVVREYEPYGYLEGEYNYSSVWFDYVEISSILDVMPYWHEYSYMYLYGFPNHNGEGLTADIISSVAVCAGTDNYDACIDFVNHLLSDDTLFTADVASFHINKEANRRMNEKLVEIAYQYYLNITPDSFDEYYEYVEEYIDSIDNIKCSDSIVMSVIMQTLVDNIIKGSDFNRDVTISDIESSVEKVLERY